MVESSVLFQTIVFSFMIAAISTDMFWGRFDMYGPYPRRPVEDPSQDRWPKKKKEESSE